MFTEQQKSLLSENLDPANVVRATAGGNGPKGDYIEGWHAINEANRIFGFDGWSYQIDLKHVCSMKNEKGNHEISYICTLELNVGGIIRQDIGYGSGAARKEGDAHESAVKEAVTDALKRALRTFGNPFGLALYDKSRAHVQSPPVEYISDDQRQELAAMLDAYGISVALFCQKAKVKSLKEVPCDKFDRSKEWIFRQSEKEKENA